MMTSIFVIGVALSFAIGYFGPEVYDKSTSHMTSDTLDTEWSGSISNMEPWHQRIFLQMRILNPTPSDPTITYLQKQVVTIWGRNEELSLDCPSGCAYCEDTIELESKCDVLVEAHEFDRTLKCVEGEDWCEWDVVLNRPFVTYNSYDMQVNMTQPDNLEGLEFVFEFEIVFIQKEFTKWEMRWFYSCCFFTLLFMFLPRIGFFYELMKVPERMWSRQQLWVSVLLVTLLSFNNIFFAFQIFSSQRQFFFDLYVVQLASFLCIMLFFWLEIFGDMANGEMQGSDPAQLWQRSRRKALKEYAPKLVLIFLIWITTILVYTYVRIEQEGDPRHVMVDDLRSFTAVKIFAIILTSIYFVWLCINICKTLRYIKRLMAGYRFVLAITSITVILTIIGLLSGELAPSELKAWPLTTFSGLYNIYVFALALCYTPIASQYANLQNDVSEMELQVPDDEEN